MKNALNICLLLTLPLIFSSCESQNDKIAKQTERMKREFIMEIENKLSSLKENSEKVRDCSYYEDNFLNKSEFFSLLYKFDNEYGYNINKTDSIISPYVGTVKFKYKKFHKSALTKEACDNAEYKVLPGEEERIFYYAYQNGMWVLKD